MKTTSPQIYQNNIKILMDISRVITSDRCLSQMLKLIVMMTAKMTNAQICSLWQVDETDQPVKITLKASQASDPDYILDRSLNLNEGVVGFIAEQKRPLVIPDVLSEPMFKEKKLARRLGLVSMLGVPLQVSNKKVVGVLNCFTAVAYDFSETEINLLTLVANQASAAIMSTELKARTRDIQEELETRKLVDRAKEIVMQRRRQTGEQAFQWLRKKSMDTRQPMRRVAEAVLLSAELD